MNLKSFVRHVLPFCKPLQRGEGSQKGRTMSDERKEAPYRFSHIGMIPECYQLRMDLVHLVEKYEDDMSPINIAWIMQWVVDHIEDLDELRER